MCSDRDTQSISSKHHTKSSVTVEASDCKEIMESVSLKIDPSSSDPTSPLGGPRPPPPRFPFDFLGIVSLGTEPPASR